jgi:hypothetical protein
MPAESLAVEARLSKLGNLGQKAEIDRAPLDLAESRITPGKPVELNFPGELAQCFCICLDVHFEGHELILVSHAGIVLSMGSFAREATVFAVRYHDEP